MLEMWILAIIQDIMHKDEIRRPILLSPILFWINFNLGDETLDSFTGLISTLSGKTINSILTHVKINFSRCHWKYCLTNLYTIITSTYCKIYTYICNIYMNIYMNIYIFITILYGSIYVCKFTHIDVKGPLSLWCTLCNIKVQALTFRLWRWSGNLISNGCLIALLKDVTSWYVTQLFIFLSN